MTKQKNGDTLVQPSEREGLSSLRPQCEASFEGCREMPVLTNEAAGTQWY
jgi:hypothetical protein